VGLHDRVEAGDGRHGPGVAERVDAEVHQLRVHRLEVFPAQAKGPGLSRSKALEEDISPFDEAADTVAATDVTGQHPHGCLR
jgi:hypothetical protein